MSLLYAIVESPHHPDITPLYRELGIQAMPINSQRKAISQLKKQAPDWIVAEFFYGWGNNYAGINVSNLDVLLHSARKYAPHAKTIVLANPREFPHVDKLTELFDIHAVHRLPLNVQAMRESLSNA